MRVEWRVRAGPGDREGFVLSIPLGSGRHSVDRAGSLSQRTGGSRALARTASRTRWIAANDTLIKHVHTDPLKLTASDIEVMDPDVRSFRSPSTRRNRSPSRIQTRSKTALALKARGNKLYSAKQYQEAIDYYTKAIQCEEQAVFYSNRAACASAPLFFQCRVLCTRR